VRGEPEVNVFGRRIASDTQRQALSIAQLALGAVSICVLVLVSISP
jgi:hypothetical protein